MADAFGFDDDTTREREPVVPAPEATPTPFAGSPMNTLYGVDSESYLTDDQRKLARQIQGKFDASMNRRDRALAQYGAPRLSSFVEDESLARAMSLARGLNYREPDALGNPRSTGVGAVPRSLGGGGSGGGGGGTVPRNALSGGSIPRIPGVTTPKTTLPAASKGANWQQIMSGLTSLAPLLFGKDAMGNFMNQGALQWAKELLFGKDAAGMVSDQAVERIVANGGMPDAGGFAVNPFTGMPIGAEPYATTGAIPGAETIYGPESGWGMVPEQIAPEFGPGSEPGWGGEWTAPSPWVDPYSATSGWGEDIWSSPPEVSWWDLGESGWGDFSDWGAWY